jgi:hypothetical protein
VIAVVAKSRSRTRFAKKSSGCADSSGPPVLKTTSRVSLLLEWMSSITALRAIPASVLAVNTLRLKRLASLIRSPFPQTVLLL